MNKTRSSIVLLLCLALAACTPMPDKYAFLHYGRQVDAKGHYDPATPALSDQLALEYAASVSAVLRARFTGARITREVSASLQVALAAIAGAHEAFDLSSRTIAILGLGSAGIPQFQGIFDAKGRAEAYQDAVRLIEEAEVEYLAHNQRPSAITLTQNGVTLVQRVSASIHVVEKTLAGRLPTVREMEQATEAMSPEGAVKTPAGAAPVNVIPANARVVVPKLKPVVITKEVPVVTGLQPKEVHAIAQSASDLVVTTTKDQANAIAKDLSLPIKDPQNPQESITERLGDPNLTQDEALAILGAVNKQLHPK